jgi:hypothetical protein
MNWLGREVSNNKWGKGKVIGQRHGDFELFVQFESGLVTWIKKNECAIVSENSNENIVMRVPQPIGGGEKEAVFNPEIINRRKAIEAFKLGIVPPIVKDFIFGRDSEIAEIKQWLSQDNENTILLYGNYGTGKSHMIQYIKNIGVDMGYVVSNCVLDPTETPLCKPKSVYRSIVMNITYSKENKSFRDLIREIVSYGESNFDNYFIDMIFHSPLTSETFWRWIEGDDISKTFSGYPTLSPWTTSANIYCNLLSAYGYFIRKKLGLKGLLLLFDEAESINIGYYTSYEYYRGINFFKGLKMMASNTRILLDEGKSYSTPVTGYKSDLIYDARTRLPYLYRIPTGVKMLFAFTPTESIMRFCSELGFTRDLFLEPLNVKTREEVVKAIQRLYLSAYINFFVSDSDLSFIQRKVIRVSGEEIRSLVKSTIEAMDLKRHWPQISVQELLG